MAFSIFFQICAFFFSNFYIVFLWEPFLKTSLARSPSLVYLVLQSQVFDTPGISFKILTQFLKHHWTLTGLYSSLRPLRIHPLFSLLFCFLGYVSSSSQAWSVFMLYIALDLRWWLAWGSFSYMWGRKSSFCAHITKEGELPLAPSLEPFPGPLLSLGA